jgi:hypothetical protein
MVVLAAKLMEMAGHPQSLMHVNPKKGMVDPAFTQPAALRFCSETLEYPGCHAPRA